MITMCSTASLRVFKTALGNLAHRMKDPGPMQRCAIVPPDVVEGKRADA